MKICVDPGHGGGDDGASAHGVAEKDITLPLALLLAEELQANGHDVVLTRHLDKYIKLPKRAEIANLAHADRFISIHANAAASKEAHGIETWFFNDSVEGRRLAARVQAAMIQEFPGSPDRGIKSRSFAVLRLTRMPAVLAEVGFITNTRERMAMRSVGWQKRAALALARGITE